MWKCVSHYEHGHRYCFLSGFNFPFHWTESQKTKRECKTSLLQQYSNSSPGEWNFMWFWLSFVECELFYLIIPRFFCVPQSLAKLGGSHPIELSVPSAVFFATKCQCCCTAVLRQSLIVQPLHQKVPPFFGKDKAINLSWKEITKPAPPPASAPAQAQTQSASTG